MNIQIRRERPEDYLVTENVIKAAFAEVAMSDKKEHELVARLRNSEHFIPGLSLVAVERGTDKMVGHILFTGIKIVNDIFFVGSLTLTSVTVLPAYQKSGIGKQLIEIGLRKAKSLKFDSVVVMGHPQYYSKFGFQKASSWGITASFEVPEEVFMAIELRRNALEQVSGVVEYPSEFFEG